MADSILHDIYYNKLKLDDESIFSSEKEANLYLCPDIRDEDAFPRYVDIAPRWNKTEKQPAIVVCTGIRRQVFLETISASPFIRTERERKVPIEKEFFKYEDAVNYLKSNGVIKNGLSEIIKEKYQTIFKAADAEVKKIAGEQKDKALMSDLADVLEDGEVITRKNPALDGEVRVKRGGLNEGLVHLIDHRIRERVLNKNVQMDGEQAKKETSAVLFLAIDNIDKAPAVKETNGNYGINYRGIKTVITKDKKGNYVVTGYDNNRTKQEATESINAVIAQYGNTPEFLGIYAQVGAVIASYNILPQSQENANRESASVPKNQYNELAKEYNGLLKEYDENIKDYNALLAAYNKSQEEIRNLKSQPRIKNNPQKIERNMSQTY